MATPNEVGAAIAEIKTRTGWTWAEVADHLGTTATYARKLAGGAGKFGAAGAGKALRGNIADFQRTGASQTPVQRAQRVRQPKGRPSAPAAPRARVTAKGAFKVERSVFRGAGRDGWAVQVTVPRGKTKTGDREDARIAIMDATRRAAQGRRRVQFRLTVQDSHGNQRTIEVGGHGGYDASRALRGMRAEGNDPLVWFLDQGIDRYSSRMGGAGGGSFDQEEMDALTERHIVGVEVIALP